MQAVGVYINTLRGAQGMKLRDVAKAANTQPSQITHIQRGRPTNAELVARVVEAVHGSPEHAHYLFVSSATVEEAKQMALEWLTDRNAMLPELEQLRQAIARAPEDRRKTALQLVLLHLQGQS